MLTLNNANIGAAVASGKVLLLAPYIYVCLLALDLVAALLTLKPINTDFPLELSAIHSDGGHAYVANLPRFPFPFALDSDSTSAGNASRVVITENNAALRVAHAQHDEIRKVGHGRYSHWGNTVYFSPLDNSSPITNGRRYVAKIPIMLDVRLLTGLLLATSLMTIFYYHPIATTVRRLLPLSMPAILALPVILSGLMAVGFFGIVNENGAAVKDADLVEACFWHGLLGLTISLIMWIVGIGLARLLFSDARETLSDAAPIGFMVSLPLSAFIAALWLVWTEFGFIVALPLLTVSLISYWLHPITKVEALEFVGKVAALFPFALFLGIWFGLELHGPTDILRGPTYGDLTYYASSIWALDHSPYPFLNLGNLGESSHQYFNMLWPAIGASVLRVTAIDPHLFITSAGGAAYVLNVGLALTFFFAGSAHKKISWQASFFLMLALSSAARYPSWIVESIPLVHAAALAITVAHRTAIKSPRASSTLETLMLGVAGSVMSKVALAELISALTLFPLAARFSQFSKILRWFVAALGAVVAMYFIFLLRSFLPAYLQSGNVGPESFLTLSNPGVSLTAAMPTLLREAGLVLIVAVCACVVPWSIFFAIASTMATGLLYPWLFRIETVAATMVAALLIATADKKMRRLWPLAYAAALLSFPASVFADPIAGQMPYVWMVCCAGIMFVSLGRKASWDRCNDASRIANPAFAIPLVAAVCAALTATAVGRGYLAVTDQHRVEAAELTPQVRDIWRAVREKTPHDSLIFTDQVSEQPTLLGGWNTYAFSGQRQIYLSNIFQSGELRNNAPEIRRRLRLNDDVLAGRVKPRDISRAGEYKSYFAVVQTGHSVSPGWHRIYGNDSHVLFAIQER